MCAQVDAVNAEKGKVASIKKQAAAQISVIREEKKALFRQAQELGLALKDSEEDQTLVKQDSQRVHTHTHTHTNKHTNR